MLWQHPELCVPDQMKDYNVEATISPTPFISPIVSGGGVYFPRKTTNRDPNFEGILGFPTIGTPEAGDLIWTDFDPRVGREQSGRRSIMTRATTVGT